MAPLHLNAFKPHAEEMNLPTCDFTFHFQLKPSAIHPHEMAELEAELDNPTGLSTVRAPPLVLDAVLVSKNCGILIEMRNAKGLKSVFYMTTLLSQD